MLALFFPGNEFLYGIAKQIITGSGFLLLLLIALLRCTFNSCSSYVKKMEKRLLLTLRKQDNI